MKLTRNRLKELIRESIKERSMLLTESEVTPDIKTVQDLLNIDQSNPEDHPREVGIMTSQWPRAQKGAKSSNKNRFVLTKFKKELVSMGYEIMEVGGRFGAPEESVLFWTNDPNKNLRRDIIALGKKYSQQAVVYGRRYISAVTDQQTGEYRDQEEVYYHYEMIETNPEDANEPEWPPGGYIVSATQDHVDFGAGVQMLKDYFSRIGSDKFVVPFYAAGPREPYRTSPRPHRENKKRTK
tara:strand:+ start:757 stop:1473 length:717 start_codon:yes stop_codon:yes gene_type:complete